MPTKSTAAKTKGKKTDAPTRCESGGPEILPVLVAVAQGASPEFVYTICKTLASVRVYLTINQGPSQLIADREGADALRVRIQPLPQGRHVLYWSLLGAGNEWQTRAEFFLNETCLYRQRKRSDGNDPFLRGFLFLEVTS